MHPMHADLFFTPITTLQGKLFLAHLRHFRLWNWLLPSPTSDSAHCHFFCASAATCSFTAASFHFFSSSVAAHALASSSALCLCSASTAL
ncbi:hypothetical protein ID866_10541 [Astraeus odoratus]|nr:hypothetical protein ID866_10541 [Astraeus odoratus]